MKRLAYITALILSLLIIYSGGGVSIVRYCCARCESKKGCKDKGCTAIIYKLDLMKHTTELTTSALVVDLLCEHFCYLVTPTYADKPVEYDSLTSPPPLCLRQKLALYSTYII